MREGLYKVEFSTPLGMGYGVVHAKGGKMLGGDSSMYYVGSYTVESGTLTATIKVDRHSPALQTTVFGRDNVTIHVAGKVNGNAIAAKGTSPQAPGIGFQANLTHISD